MEWIAHAGLGFAPGAAWLWYLRRKDALEPEPWRHVFLVFALGCMAALAVLGLRPYLEPWLPWDPIWLRDVVDAFVVTAATEESLKFAAFFLGAFWHRELDEPMDGIVYGAAAGLGFASVENMLYLWMTESPLLVLPRAFTSTLAHVACTGTLGFCVGLTRLGARFRRRYLVVLGFAAAVTFHGVYDFFLFGSGSLWWVSLLFALPLMLALLGLKIRWSQQRSGEYHAPSG